MLPQDAFASGRREPDSLPGGGRRLSILDLARRQRRPVTGTEGLHITDSVLPKEKRSLYVTDDRIESDVGMPTLE